MTEGTIMLDSEATTTPVNLFKPSSWLSKIDFINHLILFNNVMMAVLAEKQGGKTSFISLLKASLDNIHIRSLIVTLETSCNHQSLMSQLTEAFHLKPNNDMSAIVAQVNERKAHTLMIIDNAQYLDDQWIEEALSAIKQQGNQGYFHLCLFADYSIVASLNQLVTGHYKNSIHTIELSGLNEAETKIYVQHLARIENIDTSLLTDDVVNKIFKASAGDLATIHSNLNQYINDYYSKPQDKYKVVKRTTVAACVALATAGVTYNLVNNGYFSSLLNDAQRSELSQQLVKNSKPVIEANVEPILASQMPSIKDHASRTILNASSQLAAVHVIPSINLAEAVQYKPMEPELPILLSSLVKFPGFKAQKVVVAKKVEPSKNITATAEEEVLYTIQLAAREKIQPLKRFLVRNKLADKFHIHTVKGKNTQWYILTFGEYSNMTEAKKDLSLLSDKFSKMKPWIRPAEGLKQAKG